MILSVGNFTEDKAQAQHHLWSCGSQWGAPSCKWRWQTTSALRGDGTRREGVRGHKMKRQHLCSHLTGWKKERETRVAGCLREGGSSTWGQNGRHKPPSSSSQKQGDTGATVPIEGFVSQALSCFSSANHGYNEGGMLPSPCAKAVNTGPIRPWMAESAFPWKSSQWPASPGSSPCEVADSYNFNKWNRGRKRERAQGRSNGESSLTCCWGDSASDSASSYKMHQFLCCELTINDLIVADST